MPVGLLHPAFVGVGVLGAFVDDGAAAQDFDIPDVAEVQAAEDIRAGREVDRCRRIWD